MTIARLTVEIVAHMKQTV